MKTEYQHVYVSSIQISEQTVDGAPISALHDVSAVRLQTQKEQLCAKQGDLLEHRTAVISWDNVGMSCVSVSRWHRVVPQLLLWLGMCASMLQLGSCILHQDIALSCHATGAWRMLSLCSGAKALRLHCKIIIIVMSGHCAALLVKLTWSRNGSAMLVIGVTTGKKSVNRTQKDNCQIGWTTKYVPQPRSRSLGFRPLGTW